MSLLLLYQNNLTREISLRSATHPSVIPINNLVEEGGGGANSAKQNTTLSRILINDNELISIIELTLKHFII